MPIVATTVSFAMMPERTAAPASHVAKPWNVKSTDIQLPSVARMLSSISHGPLKL